MATIPDKPIAGHSPLWIGGDRRVAEPLTESEYLILRRRFADLNHAQSSSVNPTLPPAPSPPPSDDGELNKLHRRVTDVEGGVSIAISEINAIKKSMPEEDLDNHLSDHLTLIEQQKQRKEKEAENLRIWSELKKDIIGTIIKGLLVGLGVILALGFQTWVTNFTSKTVVDTPKAQIGTSK